jgi:hypothetical protein
MARGLCNLNILYSSTHAYPCGLCGGSFCHIHGSKHGMSTQTTPTPVRVRSESCAVVVSSGSHAHEVNAHKLNRAAAALLRKPGPGVPVRPYLPPATTAIQYSLRLKIFALADFCVLLLIIRLIRKNCENVIYFTMTCFIIVYILSIS